MGSRTGTAATFAGKGRLAGKTVGVRLSRGKKVRGRRKAARAAVAKRKKGVAFTPGAKFAPPKRVLPTRPKKVKAAAKKRVLPTRPKKVKKTPRGL